MYLKKLEVQGFKSFAHKTALDFERGVSVVVGPNGSGKSNVADALRFVLGEQGMKNIRAKKSEDLIFSGSGSKGKMNMAGVSLFFDNKDKVFPIDFSEVSISRKIFRDGENQYFINNSQVRLKDLSEFIAKAKIGLRGYTIINQGMGDYILNATPGQRKEIIDDALGLKEFQIKKNDSVLKLAQTKTNLEKTESLIRELTPHLRFLKRQADKLEEKEKLEKDLNHFEIKFINGRLHSLKKQLKDSSQKQSAVKALIEKRTNELERVEDKLSEEEKKVSGFFDELSSFEKELIEIESKISSLQRELGKVEGALDFQRRTTVKQRPLFVPVSFSYVKEKLDQIKKLLLSVKSSSSLDDVKSGIEKVSYLFDALVGDINKGNVKKEDKSDDSDKNEENKELKKLEDSKSDLFEELKKHQKDLLLVREKIKDINLSHHKEKDNIFNLRGKKRDLESELMSSRSELGSLEERIRHTEGEIREVEKEKDLLKENKKHFSIDEISGDISESELFGISREIDKIKIRLETAELIDESVLEEYKETKERLDFLEKETEDLKKASLSLRSAIEKLTDQIEEKFKKTFVIINKNFNRYFNILFNGGSAKLEIVKSSSQKQGEYEDNEKDVSLGVDVSVSLPGKKLSSLSVLSGGEKTLSSLALLFALVSTSPPPFLVLDEVDAPLDEANSNRFLKIIEDLKHDTQFVIITHNRETMHQADILYGVAMQDDGVSKLLSLKFKEAEKMIS